MDVKLYGMFTDKFPYYAEPLVMKKIEEGAVGNEFVSISQESAQELMDDLWRCGFRPTEGTGSAGSLAATQKHLEDMRSIVSHKLNITLK